MDRIKIFIVDDDKNLRNMLKIVLEGEGYEVIAFSSAIDAMNKLKKGNTPDLIFTDIKMPELNGIDFLKKIKDFNKDIPVIMITAYASTVDAVEAMKIGAENYINKPFNIEELKILIQRTVKNRLIIKENKKLKEKIILQEKEDEIIAGNKFQEIISFVKNIAKTDSTVLINGESGTGKELIAQLLHNQSERKTKSFISINCAAFPQHLLESELFGYVKGAFTDAYKDKVGLFEQAHKGTIFLDEIGEMPLNMQVKLLRVLQERKVRRLGDNKEIEIDVRIITATNKILQEEVEKGNFRSDLFFRLNVIPVYLPPLRERKDDIELLINHFLRIFNSKFNKNLKSFSKEIIQNLKNYNWPGNIRELENFVERAVAVSSGEVIDTDNFPYPLDVYEKNIEKNITTYNDDNSGLKEKIEAGDLNFSEYIDDISKQIIKIALENEDGHMKNTAKSLKLSYRSLRYFLEKYNLK